MTVFFTKVNINEAEGVLKKIAFQFLFVEKCRNNKTQEETNSYCDKKIN